MSGIETFLRLLEGQKQAAPVPMSNMQRTFQLPGGGTPPMAVSALEKARAEQLARGTGGARPYVLPMLRNVAQGKYISPLQKALMRQATEQPVVDTSTALQGTGDQAQTTFGQRFSQPTTQALFGAAVEGADASGWSPVPVSTGQVLARMGAGAMQAYGGALEAQERARKAKIDEEYTRAKTQAELAKTGQAFSGTSMTSQSFNTLLKIGPKIKAGTATEPEMARYDLAFGYLSKPKQQKTYDELGNETITTIPAQDLSQFPSPRGGAGTVGQETTKPSPEAIKSDKFVKAMNSMALNVNSYRQALANLNRVDMLTGAAEVPTDAMANAASIAEALRLDLKELYELGALQGGDFQILDNLLTSPNSVKGAKMGGTALSIQLDQLEKILGQKLAEKDATLSGTYSTPIPVSTPEEWAKVKIGQYGRLPNGQIKMKVQTQ